MRLSKLVATQMELERVFVIARPSARSSRARHGWQRALRILCAHPRLSLVPSKEADAGNTLVIDAAGWRAPAFDPFALDVDVAHALDRGVRTLSVDARGLAPAAVARTVREVLVHYQRLLPTRNETVLDEVLRVHRDAHDVSKPLVRADFDHARDVWQWSLRLDPRASLAVQLAALFHDIERLVSEADVRIEQRAADYEAFKAAHAKKGSAMMRELLRGAIDSVVIERAASIVAQHDRKGHAVDPEVALLEDADALSFLSVNACGFLRYYGEPHTRKKLAFTLARLSPRGLRALSAIRMREDLRALFCDARASSSRTPSTTRGTEWTSSSSG